VPLFLSRLPHLDGVSEEKRLVQAARNQDRSAFDALVNAHRDRLRAFLMRRVGPDAAEDVLQETFLAAWQAIPRLDLRVRFKTWLFSIAVHKAADYHRSQGRRAEQEVPLDPARLSLASEPVSNSFQQAEQRATVQELLDGLNDDQRQLLEMYYFAELTLPEIATVLNRNVNTVKYQFYRVHAIAAQRFELQEGVVARVTVPHRENRQSGTVGGKSAERMSDINSAKRTDRAASEASRQERVVCEG
jgi:RNA polymerase sigma-70 factor, ECF subfamily